MNVIKKNGKQVVFDLDKIKRAITKANKETQELSDSDILDIVNVIHGKLSKITREISSEEIQKMVEDTLMRKKFYETARNYIEYRYQKELDKKQNTTDAQILATVNLENEEVKQENSNKNPTLIPTQRDYMAGLVSKDLTNRYLLPKDIQDAHKAGIIHFHDADYFVQKLHNCTDGDAWIKIKDIDDNIRNIKIKDFSSELGLNNNETRDLKYSNYQILSRNGWTKFKALTKRDLRKDEDLYILKPKSGLNLKLTGEHRLPVIRDGEEALLEVKDIKVGDSLLSIDKCDFSIEEINNNFLNLSKIDSDLDIRIVNIIKLKQYLRYKYDIVFNDYINSLGVNENRAVNDNITKEEFDFILKDFEIPFDVLTSLRIKNKGSKHTYPLLIPYTEDLAKIYGYIYADGSVYVNEKESLYQLGFFNTNEDIMDDFLDSYENVFGYRMNKSYPNEKSTSPCIRVTDGSKIITSMFYNFAGAHKFCVNDIAIPDFILNGTDSIKHAFLSACIDTDGCLGEKAITYTTCSDNYADQFVYLLTSLGYHPHKRLQYEAGSIYKVWNKVGTRNYNCYSIVISNNSDIKKLNEKLATVKRQESYAYLGTSANLNYNQIISIKKMDSNEPVYDISTGDHWFILNNFVSHNCDVWNLDDMLQNGTVINGVKIDKPHSFLTACTIATQIMAIVASCQYGGQTISLSHLSPFVDISRQKIRADVERELRECHIKMTRVKMNRIIEERVKKEIKDGVQTMQYQILTLNSTNGQTPFVSLNMYLGEIKDPQGKDDLALVIEEVLNQRIKGIKNEKGVWITPAFPKLLYVLEEDNIHKDSKYFYLTELAAKCTAKRMVPDYISEKIMKQNKINENGEGDCYPCMGCRSFLTPDRSISLGNVANALNYKEGKPKYYGRFNQGVVTINLVDLACSSKKDMNKFWQIFDERAELCHRALRIRHERLLGTPSDVAPILWQHGALARLKKGETIDKLLYNGYSTISLGYAGLWECVYYMTGKKLTEPEGKDFGLKVMQKLNEYTGKWKAEENIDYSVYGTPIESTTYKFAKCLQERFGIIEGVTDKNYITNSYHIKVTEPVNAFEKLKLESEFQRLSPGGAISYIETPNLQNNIEAVISVMQFIYDNIMYAELNTKSDYCQCCGYDGEIPIVEDENYKLFFRCPVCGNQDRDKMNIARRVCGYISTNEFNQGRTQEIKERVLHL